MIYLYKNPNTGEIIEVIQKVNDKHVFSANGVEWERVFTCPAAVIKDDPFSQQAFVDKTNNKSKLADVWDRADDLSKERARKCGGKDPIKEKYYEEYSKKRKGRKHPNANGGQDGVFTI